MQSYAINYVQVLIIFVPVLLFVFLPLLYSSNEEENKFLLVVIHFSQIFALPRPTL